MLERIVQDTGPLAGISPTENASWTAKDAP